MGGRFSDRWNVLCKDIGLELLADEELRHHWSQESIHSLIGQRESENSNHDAGDREEVVRNISSVDWDCPIYRGLCY